ncbi:unnamed protein product [Didymodactylos carnosus]|uniref:G-protein coupled receptors family 1 profile domain-containing protein n=1 Tax=Didymodactylos carnosus TaxID=1234261 RepID=A0A813TK59_9BILA|nr:unnamed protein product [Didymodactylos carnosus]CAF3599930.1 unnamed protein product [Didymodactylos carnosus]
MDDNETFADAFIGCYPNDARYASEILVLCNQYHGYNSIVCKWVKQIFIADCYLSSFFYHLTAIFVIIGTILNCFSLYCFIKITKRNSQNIYLSAISLADTINLHTNFSIPLLRYFSINFDRLFKRSAWICQIHSFTTEFFIIFPTWLIVLVTLERLISIVWPLKRHYLCTRNRAKIYISLLAFICILLSSYRLLNETGIDHVSVFRVATCHKAKNNFIWLRDLNLIIWAIVPECLSFFMNLIIISVIRRTTHKLEHFYPEAKVIQHNQATKTVLLISCLFLICHTPTGVVIGFHLFFKEHGSIIGIVAVLFLRKITVILYEISLCCKFFIYNSTFRDFRAILKRSCHRIDHKNSTNLGKQLFLFSPNHIEFIFKSRDPHNQTESLLNANDDVCGDKVYNVDDVDVDGDGDGDGSLSPSPSSEHRNSTNSKWSSPTTSNCQQFDIQQQQYRSKFITKLDNIIIYNGRIQTRRTSMSAEQKSLPIQQNIQSVSPVRQWHRRTLVTM